MIRNLQSPSTSDFLFMIFKLRKKYALSRISSISHFKIYLSVCVCMHVYVCTRAFNRLKYSLRERVFVGTKSLTHTHTYIHIEKRREKERERERERERRISRPEWIRWLQFAIVWWYFSTCFHRKSFLCRVMHSLIDERRPVIQRQSEKCACDRQQSVFSRHSSTARRQLYDCALRA